VQICLAAVQTEIPLLLWKQTQRSKHVKVPQTVVVQWSQGLSDWEKLLDPGAAALMGHL
jgi:hypothetical protein